MCYLVAKDRDAHGCFALKTTHEKHLVELKVTKCHLLEYYTKCFGRMKFYVIRMKSE